MKTALSAVTGLNWKTALAIGAVLIALAGFAFWLLKRAPGAAADAIGDVAKKAGQGLDVVEKTLEDPNNRANRTANAVLRPFLGTNDYTGRPNTIGTGVEEAKRTVAGWLGF